MMKLRVFFVGLAAAFLFGIGSQGSLAEESRSMVDRDILAAEVGRVDLVKNSSGDVIQVKVNDCEQCENLSYLPSSKFRISYSGGNPLSATQTDVSGYPGTVVVNRRTNMVLEVIFWSVSSGGAQ